MNRFSFDPHRNNLIDNCAVFFFFIASWIGCPTVTLLVAPMFNKLTNLNIHEDLICPANNKESLLSYCFFCLGVFFMYAGVSFGNISKVSPESIFATLLIPFLAFSISLIHWFTSSSLISIWLTKFIAKCKEALIVSSNDTNNLLGKIKNILSIYTSLDQTFGLYFVYCFTIFQLNWIIVLYLGISAYFSKYEAQFTILFGAGSLTTALAGKHDSSISINLAFSSPDVDQSYVLHHGGRLPGRQGPGDAPGVSQGEA